MLYREEECNFATSNGVEREMECPFIGESQLKKLSDMNRT
jgi:hypothetical protein